MPTALTPLSKPATDCHTSEARQVKNTTQPGSKCVSTTRGSIDAAEPVRCVTVNSLPVGNQTPADFYDNLILSEISSELPNSDKPAALIPDEVFEMAASMESAGLTDLGDLGNLETMENFPEHAAFDTINQVPVSSSQTPAATPHLPALCGDVTPSIYRAQLLLDDDLSTPAMLDYSNRDGDAGVNAAQFAITNEAFATQDIPNSPSLSQKYNLSQTPASTCQMTGTSSQPPDTTYSEEPVPTSLIPAISGDNTNPFLTDDHLPTSAYSSLCASKGVGRFHHSQTLEGKAHTTSDTSSIDLSNLSATTPTPPTNEPVTSGLGESVGSYHTSVSTIHSSFRPATGHAVVDISAQTAMAAIEQPLSDVPSDPLAKPRRTRPTRKSSSKARDKLQRLIADQEDSDVSKTEDEEVWSGESSESEASINEEEESLSDAMTAEMSGDDDLERDGNRHGKRVNIRAKYQLQNLLAIVLWPAASLLLNRLLF